MITLAQLRSDLGRLAANLHAGVRSLQLDIDRMAGGAGDDAAPADEAPTERTLEERVAELERRYSLLEEGVQLAFGKFREWVQSQFAALVFAPGVQRSEAPSVDLATTTAQMDPQAHANLEEVRAMRLAGQRPAAPDGSLVIEAQDPTGAELGTTRVVGSFAEVVGGEESDALRSEEAAQKLRAAEDAQRALDDVRAARVAGIAQSPAEESAPVTPRDGQTGDTPDGV